MRLTIALLFALSACGSVADGDGGNNNDTPDAGLDQPEPDAAEVVCTPAPSLLAVGNPQGGFSAQKTIAVAVTPIGGDQLVNALEISGIGLLGGTYTLSARIYDTATEELVASSEDVTQEGPFPNFTTTFDISATLLEGETYALSVFTSGGGRAATAVVLADELLPFDAATGAFRVERGNVSGTSDQFPRQNLNGLPQITAHSCRVLQAD